MHIRRFLSALLTVGLCPIVHQPSETSTSLLHLGREMRKN